jgi:hypothetical protein
MIDAKGAARAVLVAGTAAIGVGYLAAFGNGGAPVWAAWLLALGIPATTVAIMVLGAHRKGRSLRKLAIPFSIVAVLLALGFCLALALPAETAASRLILGLPLRAAIIVYGIGLLPTLILPVAYAITFESQTLDEEDVARARQLGKAFREEQ